MSQSKIFERKLKSLITSSHKAIVWLQITWNTEYKSCGDSLFLGESKITLKVIVYFTHYWGMLDRPAPCSFDSRIKCACFADQSTTSLRLPNSRLSNKQGLKLGTKNNPFFHNSTNYENLRTGTNALFADE